MPSIMQKNYSHCPLKKRPVQIVKEEITEIVIPEIVSNDEPQNLSTKPEDLSLTGNYPRKTPSPVFRQRTPSPIRRSVSPIRRSVSPIRRSISPIPIPTPTYAPVPINYIQKSSPIHHQIAMHSPTPSNEQLHYASPTNWHKPIAAPTAAYPSYMFAGYPQMNYHNDHYQSMYHHQVSPTRSEPLSPYAQRESSMSPPSHHQYQIKRESSLSPPTMSAYPELRRVNHNNNIIKTESHYTNRYMPYHLNHHHVIPHHPMMMPVDQSSLSPTSSHTSYNSMISSSIRSASPTSLPSSTPEDLSQIANHSVSVLMEKSSSCANILKVKKENNGEKLNGAPRYQCNDCGKSYSTYSGLTKHTQFHCPAAEGNQAKKSFSCKNCDKVYVSLGALKMHIRTHTLPCKCQICGKAFSRPWLLQGHIRTHTGEKPFSCQHCHRAFADRSNLRAHLQTHSDVKKYSCTSCSKTFSRMSLLTKHTEGGCPGLQIGSQGYSSSIKQELSVY